MHRKFEEKLLEWKNKIDRKPLLLYGARQVGKTYLLTQFGEQYFDNMVYINLHRSIMWLIWQNIQQLQTL